MAPDLTELITTAFMGGASDVFLVEGERPRVRNDGEVIIAHGESVARESLTAVWRACGLDPEEARDGDASLEVETVGRLRVNAYRTLGRIAVVMRPIKKVVASFEELGLPEELLTGWMKRRSGLVLVAGSTGSGKSTTVAACLEWINRNQKRHVVTIEDPIEYLFANKQSLFSQREVHRDTGDFATALRQSMRQHPDVIFLGEIRDAESSRAAVRAAETGHLVISTVHGSGASGVASSMERIGGLIGSDSSHTRALFANQLIGVMSQQLLPRINGGMVAVLEYFQNVPITRKLIGEGRYKEIRDHIEGSTDDLACPFMRYLVAATQQNIIDPETARAACDRPQDFDRVMRGIS